MTRLLQIEKKNYNKKTPDISVSRIRYLLEFFRTAKMAHKVSTLILCSIALFLPTLVGTVSWLAKETVDGGTCACSICSCNGNIDGTQIWFSANSPHERKCQLYYRKDQCTFHDQQSSHLDSLHIATDAIGDLPRDVENDLLFGVCVSLVPTYRDGNITVPEQYKADCQFPNQKRHPSTYFSTQKLTIDLCPTEHTIDNSTLSSFQNLQQLTINGNHASVTINETGFLSRMHNLKHLHINHAKLETVAVGEFCQLRSLDDVVVTFSHPSVIDGFNCVDLCEQECLSEDRLTMDLTGNQIPHIHFSFNFVAPRLDELNLSQNALLRVESQTFSGLASLTMLDLSENKIVFIHPRAFDKMGYLQKLYLGHNRLAFLHQQWFKGHAFLWVISLAHNCLQTVGGNCFPDSIQEIHLEHNEISGFTGDAFQDNDRRNLNLLNLTHNRLRSFTNSSITACLSSYCHKETATMQLLLQGNR